MTLVEENIPQPTTAEGEEVEPKKEWRIEWKPSLIFAELDDRSLVHFFTRVPNRGGIYDRMGRELAVDASLAVVGIVPDLLTDKEAVIAGSRRRRASQPIRCAPRWRPRCPPTTSSRSRPSHTARRRRRSRSTSIW